MYTQRLSSLEFFTYAAFFTVVVLSIASILPGRKPPVRTEPYADDELHAHDRRLPKYFLTGGAFLLLGGLHMVLKNLPWTAEWLARAGYAGHLVRDLSNTHVMIVGGGTLISTGLCWYVLPRIVRRPLVSPGLAQGAFWFTAVGLLVFYVALIANGIAMGRLVSNGWDYEAAKLHMGKAYRVPVGIGAGVMGLGYWCFAANVFLTVFQARLVRVPKPSGHLWKFLVTGAAGLTVGTVQGVIQVQPAHAAWLYRAGHAGEWIDPISHAHINLVTGLTMLTAGAIFALAPTLGGQAPSRRLANTCFWSLLGGSLAFYGVALYLGFHEGRLVVRHGLTPEQAEEATRLHPFLIMGAGIAMLAAFWLLLVTLVRSFRRARHPVRAVRPPRVRGARARHAPGPVQAFPAVNELLDRGGDAGDVIVNLHAQLNMLGGLMVILIGRRALAPSGRQLRSTRSMLVGVGAGMAVYYAGGIAFARCRRRTASPNGGSFGAAVARVGALAGPRARSRRSCSRGRVRRIRTRRVARHGRLPRRGAAVAPARALGVRRSHPEARSPASACRCRCLRSAHGPARVPRARLALRGLSACRIGAPADRAGNRLGRDSARVHALRERSATPGRLASRVDLAAGEHARLDGPPLPRASPAALASARLTATTRWLRRSYRTRVAVSVGAIGLLLVALPFVPAVAGIGGAPSATRTRPDSRVRSPASSWRRPAGRSSSSPGATRRDIPGGRTASACVRPQSAACARRSCRPSAVRTSCSISTGKSVPLSFARAPARAHPRASQQLAVGPLRLRGESRRHVRGPRLRVCPSRGAPGSR